MKKSFFISLIVALLLPLVSYAAAPAGYYKSAEGKNKSALLKQLYSIVGPHTNVGYDGLYNVYNTSDVTPDGYVWDMYSNAKYRPGQNKCGSYKNIGDCYNREHTFPQSWFGKGGDMKSDAYQVYPTDGKVNGWRSSYPYGECLNGEVLTGPGNLKSNAKMGSCTFPGYSGRVFEPADEYKGDIARTYFYMAAAYNSKFAGFHSEMLANNDYPCYKTWAVSLLLKWHRQDPVSQKELDRNEAVSKHQRNRNPFIDHPELAEYIWGDRMNDGWVPGGIPTPVLNTPANGTAYDLGMTSLNAPLSQTINVKGAALSKNLTVSCSNATDFEVSSTSLDFNAVNNGVSLTITFKALTEGEKVGTVTISSSEVSTMITVKGAAYNGIPAKPATNVGEDRFDANWLKVSNETNYKLYVYQGADLMSGYPVDVNAASLSYTVTGLAPSTEYSYKLTSASLTSNTVNVRTMDPIPEIVLNYAAGCLTSFATEPNTASASVEVTVSAENIIGDITATVDGNFEISFDNTNWNTTLSLNNEGEKIYVRCRAVSQEGTYTGVLTASASNFEGDEADLKAVVAFPRSFFEDWEQAKTGGYFNTEIQGTACKWNMSDVGVWADKKELGNAARFGKNDNSSVEMAEDKMKGVGTITFKACEWGSDAASNATQMEVLGSTDGGLTWKSLGLFDIDGEAVNEYSLSANIEGAVRLKFAQVAGKRMILDDIALTDCLSSVIENVEDESWSIVPAQGGVVVRSETPAEVIVYSIDASVVAQQKLTDGEVYISLQKGIYIVTLDDARGEKIVVR